MTELHLYCGWKEGAVHVRALASACSRTHHSHQNLHPECIKNCTPNANGLAVKKVKKSPVLLKATVKKAKVAPDVYKAAEAVRGAPSTSSYELHALALAAIVAAGVIGAGLHLPSLCA